MRLRRMVAGLLLGKLVLQLSSPNFLEKERTSQIETYLTGVVGDVLGREVGGDEPLLDAGLDSLGMLKASQHSPAEHGC